jgi:hypothetical protein
MKNRLAAHVGGEVVVLVGDLALMGQVDPVTLEDVPHLELEDLGIGEDVPGYAEHALLGVVLQRGVDGLLDSVEHAVPPVIVLDLLGRRGSRTQCS